MSEKVFAPRLARRTFLAASAASAALMLTGCLNLAPRYEKPAAPTETSQDWAVSPRDAGVKEGELVTWDKFFLDERLRKVIELALANNRDLRQSMKWNACGRSTGCRAPSSSRRSGLRRPPRSRALRLTRSSLATRVTRTSMRRTSRCLPMRLISSGRSAI